MFRKADIIEDINSGKLKEYIESSKVFNLIKSIKLDNDDYTEFYYFFVVR